MGTRRLQYIGARRHVCSVLLQSLACCSEKATGNRKNACPTETGLKSVGPRVRVRHAGQSRVSVPEMNWPRQTLSGFFLARVGRGTKIIARINTSSLPAADARQTVVPRWRITRPGRGE